MVVALVSSLHELLVRDLLDVRPGEQQQMRQALVPRMERPEPPRVPLQPRRHSLQQPRGPIPAAPPRQHGSQCIVPVECGLHMHHLQALTRGT